MLQADKRMAKTIKPRDGDVAMVLVVKSLGIAFKFIPYEISTKKAIKEERERQGKEGRGELDYRW